jgi:DNA-binding transcriptional LysR family regulator
VDPTRLAGFDLNLLVVLDILLAERSVTRAAKRLGLTQSAVSNALARLRAALGDDLLVRAGNAMVPTSRALALERGVREAIERVGHALEGGASFEPATAQRTFVIAATDYVQFVLLGALVERIRRVARGVSIQIVSPGKDFPWTGLEAGSVDLLLAGDRAGPMPPLLHRRWLFRDQIVCLLRSGHRFASGSLTLAKYLELDHIEALPIGAVGLADELLAAHGHRRRIVLTVPHFLIAPFVVMESDCCFTLAQRIAGPLAERLPVKRLPLPFGPGEVRIAAYWHDRAHREPAHRWLRRQVTDVNASIS